MNHLEDRVSDVLELTGLADRRKDLVRTFSRGMTQRLTIGRAVIHDPKVILFDEPYTGLDQNASGMLDRVLMQIAAQKRTVIMTTHDLIRAETVASRFDVLNRGKVIASRGKRDLQPGGLMEFYRQALENNLL